MDRSGSDRDAYPDRGAFRIRTDDLTNSTKSPAQSNSERSALDDSLDGIAGGVIKVRGHTSAEAKFIEEDLVAPGASLLRRCPNASEEKSEYRPHNKRTNPDRTLFVSVKCVRD